jgi:hypothetical protein
MISLSLWEKAGVRVTRDQVFPHPALSRRERVDRDIACLRGSPRAQIRGLSL